MANHIDERSSCHPTSLLNTDQEGLLQLLRAILIGLAGKHTSAHLPDQLPYRGIDPDLSLWCFIQLTLLEDTLQQLYEPLIRQDYFLSKIVLSPMIIALPELWMV